LVRSGGRQLRKPVFWSDLLERFQQADQEEGDQLETQAQSKLSETAEQDLEAVRQALGQQTLDRAERGGEPVGPTAKTYSHAAMGKRARSATRPSANGGNGRARSIERPIRNEHDGHDHGSGLRERV
jgi:hypothetical protein